MEIEDTSINQYFILSFVFQTLNRRQNMTLSQTRCVKIFTVYFTSLSILSEVDDHAEF